MLFSDNRVIIRAEDQSWTPVSIVNSGFEEVTEKDLPKGWFAASPGYTYRTSEENANSGVRSLQIERQRRYSTSAIFKGKPPLGEVIEQAVGSGLSCRIPLALPRKPLERLLRIPGRLWTV